MLRNNTNFPTQLTGRLREAYLEFEQLRRTIALAESDDGATDRERLSMSLKYYQFLVHKYLTEILPEMYQSLSGRAASDVPRGLLVYHKMGLGKTFAAISAVATVTGAVKTTNQSAAEPNRVIFVSAKSLHANFEKTAKKFFRIFYGAEEDRVDRAVAHIMRMTSFVTLNAHNMADQVVRATKIAQMVSSEQKAQGAVPNALDGLFLIVDEAHDFFQAIINNPSPTTNARRLFTMIMSAQRIRLMFLTGTPSAKHPFELVPCFNMLTGKELLPVQYDNFVKHFVDGVEVKDRGRLANRLVGLVSYAGYDLPPRLEIAPQSNFEGGEESAPPTVMHRPSSVVRDPQIQSQTPPGGRHATGVRALIEAAGLVPSQLQFHLDKAMGTGPSTKNPKGRLNIFKKSYVGFGWTEPSYIRKYASAGMDEFSALPASIKNALDGNKSFADKLPMLSRVREAEQRGVDVSFVPKSWDLEFLLKNPKDVDGMTLILKQSKGFGQTGVRLLGPKYGAERVDQFRTTVRDIPGDAGNKYVVSELVGTAPGRPLLLWNATTVDPKQPGNPNDRRKFHVRTYLMMVVERDGSKYAHMMRGVARVLTASKSYSAELDLDVHLSGASRTTHQGILDEYAKAGLGWSKRELADAWKEIERVSYGCAELVHQKVKIHGETRAGYAIYGLDILFTQSPEGDLKAHLIEINHNPAFAWAAKITLPFVSSTLEWALSTAVLPHFGTAQRPYPLWRSQTGLDKDAPFLSLRPLALGVWDVYAQSNERTSTKIGHIAITEAADSSWIITCSAVEGSSTPALLAEALSQAKNAWSAYLSKSLDSDEVFETRTEGFDLPLAASMVGGARSARPVEGSLLNPDRRLTLALRAPDLLSSPLIDFRKEFEGVGYRMVFNTEDPLRELKALKFLPPGRKMKQVDLAWSEKSHRRASSNRGLNGYYATQAELKNRVDIKKGGALDKGQFPELLRSCNPSLVTGPFAIIPGGWDPAELYQKADGGKVELSSLEHMDWAESTPAVLRLSDSSNQVGVVFIDAPVTWEKISAQMRAVSRDECGQVALGKYTISHVVPDPLLFQGRKFHLRVLILMQVEGGRFFMHVNEDHAIVYTAANPYEPKDWDNRDVHLSGLATTVYDTDSGHAYRWLKDGAWGTGLEQKEVDQMWKNVRSAIGATAPLFAKHVKLYQESASAYQIFGADIMLSRDGRPWIIETNRRPGWGLPIKRVRKAKLKFELGASVEIDTEPEEVDYPRILSVLRWTHDVVIKPHYGLAPRPTPDWEGPLEAPQKINALRDIDSGVTIRPLPSPKGGHYLWETNGSDPVRIQIVEPRDVFADGLKISYVAKDGLTPKSVAASGIALVLEACAARMSPYNAKVSFEGEDPLNLTSALSLDDRRLRREIGEIMDLRRSVTFRESQKGGRERPRKSESQGLTIALRIPQLRKQVPASAESIMEKARASGFDPRDKAWGKFANAAWTESSSPEFHQDHDKFNRLKADVKNALGLGKRAITNKGRLYLTLDNEQWVPKTCALCDDKCTEFIEPDKWYILKVSDNSPMSYGQRGVSIWSGSQLLASRSQLLPKPDNDAPPFIVSDLVPEPLLWEVREGDRRKFHLRVYVLVYVNGGSLCRAAVLDRAEVYTAAVRYVEPQSGMVGSDLSKSQLSGGSSTHMPWFWHQDGEKHLRWRRKEVDEAWAQVRQIARSVGAAIATNTKPYPESRAGFEVFGLDVMFDRAGQAWLLEVNDRLGWREMGKETMSGSLAESIFDLSMDVAVLPHFALKAPDLATLVWVNAPSHLIPLHQLTDGQLAQLVGFGKDPEIFAHLGTGEPWDYEKFADLRRQSAEDSQGVDQKYFHWALGLYSDKVDQAEVPIAGYISLRPRHHERSLQLRYFIGQPYQRKGLASDAIRHVLETRTTPDHVFAHVDPKNTKSIALLKKLGFAPAGEGKVGKRGKEKTLQYFSRAPRGARPTFCGGEEPPEPEPKSTAPKLDLPEDKRNTESLQSQIMFPTLLPLKVEKVAMGEEQYRRYLKAREKESEEGGAPKGGSGGGAPPPRAKPQSMSLPGSEREGGSTYYVMSRMTGNVAIPSRFSPTGNVLEASSISGINVETLPVDAFDAETSPKIEKILENIEKTDGPFLIYSQFTHLGGLSVVERYLQRDGYERFDASATVTGGDWKHPASAPQTTGVNTVHGEFIAALEYFPMSPTWVHLIEDIAGSPQDFDPNTQLRIPCGQKPREVVRPVPKNVPLALVGLVRPSRAMILALVRFLTQFAKSSASTAGWKLGGPLKRLGGEAVEFFKELFPFVEVEDVEREWYTLEDKKGASATLMYHEDNTVCDRCVQQQEPEAFWSTWAPNLAPGAHFHYHCTKDQRKKKAPQPCRHHTFKPEVSMPYAAAHLMYDRSWARYKIPVSKKFGQQDLEKVPGYDACWDCTAEAHTWMLYISTFFAEPGILAGKTSHTFKNDEKLKAGYFMNRLTEVTSEGLLSNVSAHGRFLAPRGQSAILAAASHYSQKLRHLDASTRTGGAQSPQKVPRPKKVYAVISGDVPPPDRARIQEVWSSEANRFGEIIGGILLTKAGALGVDLPNGRQVHLLEPYWNKSLEDQVIARFFRVGALSFLPVEQRTIQPYLYLAVANEGIIEGMTPDSRERPAKVGAGLTFPLGTTVDVVFHEKALVTHQLNNNFRELLQEISIERALVMFESARVCRPTNVPLFHNTVEEDIQLPDPCIPLTESKIRALKITHEGSEYRYTEDPTHALGYRFYRPDDSREWGREGIYVEIPATSPLYIELVEALDSRKK